ncbi:MAG: hypothetical protein QOJ15_2287 [Bradyrhizobium sp.]|nr:hypothetical protein [Bradyrhizobium sp.]
MEEAEIERLLGGPPRVGIEDIVNHPRLAQARKVYLDRFLDVYGGDPFLVRLLIESGRFIVYFIASTLEAAQDPARPETWLTIGLLKRTMGLFGLASGRHIDHLIARLCEVGYMEARVSETDRRVRLLKPTDAFRAHDRDWIAAHFAPLAVLYPQHDYSYVMRRDPKFHAAYRRTGMAFLPLGARLFSAVPDMTLFMNRAGGYMVIASLLQITMTQGDQSHAAVPYADVGDRFGISRTHVRKLLVTAEGAGLVKPDVAWGRRASDFGRKLAIRNAEKMEPDLENSAH